MEEEFRKRYSKLNKEQKEAVDNIEGPVLVISGPGAGKTEVLGMRVANILRKGDVYPGNILSLTFTESAAFNMQTRLKDIIGPDAHNLPIFTFHGLGSYIINRYQDYFSQFSFHNSAGETEQFEILQEILPQTSHKNSLAKLTRSNFHFNNLKNLKEKISQLKKAGLSPEKFEKILDKNKKDLDYLSNIICPVFNERITKKTLKKAEEALIKIEYGNFVITPFRSLAEVCRGTLKEAIRKAKEENRTNFLTKWKDNWLCRDEDKKLVFVDLEKEEKQRDLLEIYKLYQEKLAEEGKYDFNDMILKVIEVLENNKELKYTLQEKFQYILVDEFQDSNDSQVKLLEILTDNPINEEQPNIFAVADDDQAIFKFQGANASNLIRFVKNYRETKKIILKKNYRAVKNIVDFTKEVINQKENSILTEEKEMISSRGGKGKIELKEFENEDEEYFWISQKIKEIVAKGGTLAKIGVISRKHKELEEFSKYLSVPYFYEKQGDALKNERVLEIFSILELLCLFLDNPQKVNALMPKILSFPFWEIEREKIWEISLERDNWIKAMKKKGGRLKQIADFLIKLSVKSQNYPVDKIINEIIGSDETKNKKLRSPFKNYYFSEEKFKKDPNNYLRFLSAIRSFLFALREYKPKEPLYLKDALRFAEIHKENNLPVPNTFFSSAGSGGVNLLTAHKAKGLEFDVVFVLNCRENVWAKKGAGGGMSFPKNLPITPAGDTRDDQLRLFFVAASRAKNDLFLCFSKKNKEGREVLPLSFIPKSAKSLEESVSWAEKRDILEKSIAPFQILSFKNSEKKLLEKELENYKLNVTHINNFLDVSDGGPQNFFETNLLRFPQPKTTPLSFGTAIHKTLERVAKEKRTDTEKIEQWFREALVKERLGEKDFKKFFEQGKEALKVFYKQKRDILNPNFLTEFNFNEQGCRAGDIPISGKIDLMLPKEKEKEMFVYDYKTGKYARDWKGRGDWEKIKLWKYRNQLIFYKILVESSSDFGNFKVNKGILEFVEPDKKSGEIAELSLDISEEDAAEMKEIAKAVYKKIMNLNFPDIEKYPKSIKGVKQFQEDILS